MYTDDIFRLVDLCAGQGNFPGLEDLRYALLLRWSDGSRVEIHRADQSCLLPSPCRIWCVKGAMVYLLGDSHALPVDLSAGVRPPYIG